MIGAICLQGPQPSDQKSTITGTDEFRTSASKLSTLYSAAKVFSFSMEWISNREIDSSVPRGLTAEMIKFLCRSANRGLGLERKRRPDRDLDTPTAEFLRGNWLLPGQQCVCRKASMQ